MNLERIQKLCLSFPGATENVQWENDLCFKVAGKIFAITGFSPESGISFKCDPETFAELTEGEGIIPAPYLARYKWVSIQSPEAVSSFELEKLLRRSYELVVQKLSKKVREKL